MSSYSSTPAEAHPDESRTVIPVPGPWGRDIIGRAAAELARHYLGQADGSSPTTSGTDTG